MATASPIQSLRMRPRVPDPDPTMGLPGQGMNGMQQEAPNPREMERLAKEILEGHRKGKERRRLRDLTAEKYLVHIDGEGDGQWADIINGTRVAVPPSIGGGLRWQHNLLRPLVENWVAYHTGQTFQVVAQAKLDRASRDEARINTIFANAVIRQNRLNELFADALFHGAPYGHGVIHGTWRDDQTSDAYEPLYSVGEDQYEGMDPQMMPRRGKFDAYVGDPWDTIYNAGAKRNSIQWASYGRVLPITLVQQVFGDVPGVDALKGRTDLPSASRFQRVVRRWHDAGQGVHGTSAMFGQVWGDELIAIICREIAPGLVPEYPDGALQIIALDGASETDTDTVGARAGRPVLIHDGPLPGRRFSFVPIYAGFRGDDVLGKPYVADLDDLQVQLNQLITLEAEYVRRYARPPLIVGPGGLVDDTITTEDDAILEMAADGHAPQFLYPPPMGTSVFQGPIQRIMDNIFRLGGWQAASRGESKSGDPASKVIALMRADDTIFGPVNNAMRNSLSSFLQLAHALARENMHVPMDVTAITGEDLAYLSEPYITRDDLSEDPPDYQVVSGYGATPEATGQQLLQLVQMQGADGQPLLSTEEFWKRFPDHTLRPPEIGAGDLREQAAARVNYAIQSMVRDLREQIPEEELEQILPQLMPQAFAQLMQTFPIKRTDVPQMHVESLDMLIHDVDEDPLVVQLATQRQEQYFEWLMSMQQGQPAEAPAPQRGGSGGRRPPQRGSSGIIGSGERGPITQENVRSEVNRLSREARGR